MKIIFDISKEDIIDTNQRVIALNLDDREDKELRKLLYDGSVKLLAYITRPKFIKSGNN